MKLTVLKGKIHQATVTHCSPEYEGACVVSSDLLSLAGIREYEKIHIYNATNGERFSTYALLAEPNEGIVSLNGAATYKVRVGDRIVICAYASVKESELDNFTPNMVYLNPDNSISHTANASPLIQR